MTHQGMSGRSRSLLTPEEQAALEIFDHADTRLSARAFIREIKARMAVPGRQAKRILRHLVDTQQLAYHYLYGNTYVEKSFLKPVAVTPHFTIQPPGFNWQRETSAKAAAKGMPPIVIHQGISFGSGQHPTTRLCLKAIDHCFFKNPAIIFNRDAVGADIGTGSGVLAIAMSLAGISLCRACEIDPISVNEAKKNIYLNRLEKKIELTDSLFTPEENTFSIICANLRWPTLNTLAKAFYQSLKTGGVAVLSGVRTWEKEHLLERYAQTGFSLIWQRDEKKWSGFVLIKKVC